MLFRATSKFRCEQFWDCRSTWLYRRPGAVGTSYTRPESLSQAQPQGGLIRLATRVEGDWVRFEVIDRGPGLDPALQAKIFEPFYTTKGHQQGTGLGLATV